jgi:hypothetical protein
MLPLEPDYRGSNKPLYSFLDCVYILEFDGERKHENNHFQIIAQDD